MTQINYYKTLQVDSSADPEIIDVAYKRLARKYHPDINKSTDATARMQQLNEAYATLSNPILRAEYDRQLMNQVRQSHDYYYHAKEQKSQADEEASHVKKDFARQQSEAPRTYKQKAEEKPERNPRSKQQNWQMSVCPKCQRENSEQAWYCIHCGYNLKIHDQKIQEQKFEQNEQKAYEKPNVKPDMDDNHIDKNLVTCPKCQEYNSVHKRYCMHCGARL